MKLGFDAVFLHRQNYKMKFINHHGRHYISQSLPFSKSFEAGVQDVTHHSGWLKHTNFYFEFNTKGRDHAGLKMSAQLGRWFFELNITDNRHWDYENNSWVTRNKNESKS
jgi:hypothetical protein